MRSVKGTENSVLACVTPEIREIAIVPSTSEGAGKMMARYVVPPTYKGTENKQLAVVAPKTN